jgi:hypothetical protein
MTQTAKEVLGVVKEIRTISPRETRSVSGLRTTLRGALRKFEEALNALPIEQRTVAESLYLDRIRKLTFHFHLAMQTEVSTQKAKAAHRRDLAQVLSENEAASFEIARLYGFE